MKYSDLKKQIKKIILEELSNNKPEFVIQQFLDNKVEDLEWNGLYQFHDKDSGTIECSFIFKNIPYSILGETEIEIEKGEITFEIVYKLTLINAETEESQPVPDHLFEQVENKFLHKLHDYLGT